MPVIGGTRPKTISMLSQNQRENATVALKELFSLWDSRASSYSKILFCSAVAKGHDGKWKNVTTFFLPLHTKETFSPGRKSDYGEFLMVEDTLSLDKTKATLTDVVERDRLSLPGLPEIAIEATPQTGNPMYPWNSANRRYPVAFPYREFTFNVYDQYKGQSPQTALHHVDLPLFPSGSAAMEKFFGTRLGDSSYGGWFAALVPDYRGRIDKVVLGKSSVEVQITCLAGASEGELIGKLYAKHSSGSVDCADMVFANSKGTAHISDSPRDLLVALLWRADGDLVDYRQFAAGSPYPSDGDVVFEEPEQNIEQTILLGETETVEFKKELPNERARLAVGAVALANRNGGQILVGVSDDTEVVGCTIERPKDVVAQILRNYCEPLPEFDVEEIMVRGKPIVRIVVREGKDKPYNVREKGFYIRIGGTNRRVTRYELDEMYSPKQNPFANDV